VRAGAIRMHVSEAGAGDPAPLPPGCAAALVSPATRDSRLAAEHGLLCADLRVRWSEAPRSSYAKQELMDDVIALLDALEPDRVRLVGR